jgi:hypothetical protein
MNPSTPQFPPDPVTYSHLLFPQKSVTWMIPFVNWEITRSMLEWLILGTMICIVLLILILFLIKLIIMLATGGTLSISALFFGNPFKTVIQSALRVVVFPFVEEILFRYLLIWLFFHDIIGAGMMASFWWSFVGFLLGHIIDIVVDIVTKGDIFRILDPINIGTLNFSFMTHAILVQKVEPFIALAGCILMHMVYNGVIELFRFLKLNWLVILIRLAVLFLSFGGYWLAFSVGKSTNLWQW